MAANLLEVNEFCKMNVRIIITVMMIIMLTMTLCSVFPVRAVIFIFAIIWLAIATTPRASQALLARLSARHADVVLALGTLAELCTSSSICGICFATPVFCLDLCFNISCNEQAYF